MTIHWTLYRSTPADAPWPATILDIARSSETFNPETGITGFLFYSSAVYLQYVEGERRALEAWWRRVSRDPRHRIGWAVRGTSPARRFAGLPMGYFDAQRETSALRGAECWTARTTWPDADAEAIVSMMTRLAREKYPTAMSPPGDA